MPCRRSAAAATQHVQAWTSAVQDVDLYLSALTLSETRPGIEGLRERDPVQADVFAGWLRELHSRFTERILPMTHRWQRNGDA